MFAGSCKIVGTFVQKYAIPESVLCLRNVTKRWDFGSLNLRNLSSAHLWYLISSHFLVCGITICFILVERFGFDVNAVAWKRSGFVKRYKLHMFMLVVVPVMSPKPSMEPDFFLVLPSVQKNWRSPILSCIKEKT